MPGALTALFNLSKTTLHPVGTLLNTLDAFTHINLFVYKYADR